MSDAHDGSSLFPATPQAREEWISSVRAMDPVARIPVINGMLVVLSGFPMTEAVFFRKRVLRLLDESRLDAGVITPEGLHRENSPFARMDFRRAKINFRARRPKA